MFQVISPSVGTICIHCELGGTNIGFWSKSVKVNDSLMSFLLQVPSMTLPLLNIVTGPTPTVKILGNVVFSSL